MWFTKFAELDLLIGNDPVIVAFRDQYFAQAHQISSECLEKKNKKIFPLNRKGTLGYHNVTFLKFFLIQALSFTSLPRILKTKPFIQRLLNFSCLKRSGLAVDLKLKLKFSTWKISYQKLLKSSCHSTPPTAYSSLPCIKVLQTQIIEMKQ